MPPAEPPEMPIESEDNNDENVSFLRSSLAALDQAHSSSARPTRSHIDHQRDPRTRIRSTNILPSPPPPPAHAERFTIPHTSSPPPPPPPAESSEDRRQRLQQILARLNRIHDPSVTGPSATAYSNRTPSPRASTLYDWAPAHDESPHADETELDQILAELRRAQPDTHPDILRVLSHSQLETSRRRDRNAQPATGSAESELRRDRQELTEALERSNRLRERRRGGQDWVSLRSRVALQRARQEGGSVSATERMLRYVMDRERSGMSEEEERARGTGWFNPEQQQQHRSGGSNRESWPLPPTGSELRSAMTTQEVADAMQRRYVAENPPLRLPRISTPPVPSNPASSDASTLLENALKYLDQLRSCYRYEDGLSAAMDQGLATKEFFADKHHDFIMDLGNVEHLAETSWLQPGTTFEGHQHATSAHAALLHSRSSSGSHHIEQINPHFINTGIGNSAAFDHPPGSTTVAPFDATRPWLSRQFTPPTSTHSTTSISSKFPDPAHDHWPVRVRIHALDREKMTLQGTMEAYDVPQHPASLSILNSTERPRAGKKNAPITTYLEGHIIDLTTHSFLTPCTKDTSRCPYATASQNTTPYNTLTDTILFPSATPHTDASNWRKLPPFSALASDEDAARCLLSKDRMNAINEQYLFMRWKERCFVHTKEDNCSEEDRRGDQDRGHGLTISGFYYVSLRRSDGVVEGLYFDPTSTPYQHLRLRGGKGGWPAFEFR